MLIIDRSIFGWVQDGSSSPCRIQCIQILCGVSFGQIHVSCDGWSNQHKDFSTEFVIEKLTLFFALDDQFVTFSFDFPEILLMRTVFRPD